MDYIQSKIHEIASELIKHRRYNYCQDTLYTYLQANPNIKCQHSLVKNKRGENLDTILLKGTYSDTCIVYAHGLGSNKIQVLPMVQYFKSSFHICAFDFSGSGRSDGSHTTFGLREQDDVNAILAWLDAGRQYSRYILWGRSMGGASVILSQARNINKKVQCIILDSPFSSFQKAALQIASRSTIIPQLMLSFIIEPIKQIMKKEYPHLNPFDLDICGAASRIQTRIMLIYSKGDSIVNFSHSKQISKNCQRNAVQVQIQQDHNKPRKKQAYAAALRFINQSMQMIESRAKRSSSKGRGISVSSKQNKQSCKPRTSISTSVNSEKYSKFNRTQKFVSIGSFASCSSSQMEQNSKQNLDINNSKLIQNLCSWISVSHLQIKIVLVILSNITLITLKTGIKTVGELSDLLSMMILYLCLLFSHILDQLELTLFFQQDKLKSRYYSQNFFKTTMNIPQKFNK